MQAIGKDKYLHAGGCFGIALVIGIIAGPVAGFAAAMLVGVIKEGVDCVRPGGVASMADIAADAVGAAAGALAAAAIVGV